MSHLRKNNKNNLRNNGVGSLMNELRGTNLPGVAVGNVFERPPSGNEILPELVRSWFSSANLPLSLQTVTSTAYGGNSTQIPPPPSLSIPSVSASSPVSPSSLNPSNLSLPDIECSPELKKPRVETPLAKVAAVAASTAAIALSADPRVRRVVMVTVQGLDRLVIDRRLTPAARQLAAATLPNAPSFFNAARVEPFAAARAAQPSLFEQRIAEAIATCPNSSNVGAVPGAGSERALTIANQWINASAKYFYRDVTPVQSAMFAPQLRRLLHSQLPEKYFTDKAALFQDFQLSFMTRRETAKAFMAPDIITFFPATTTLRTGALERFQENLPIACSDAIGKSNCDLFGLAEQWMADLSLAPPMLCGTFSRQSRPSVNGDYVLFLPSEQCQVPFIVLSWSTGEIEIIRPHDDVPSTDPASLHWLSSIGREQDFIFYSATPASIHYQKQLPTITTDLPNDNVKPPVSLTGEQWLERVQTRWEQLPSQVNVDECLNKFILEQDVRELLGIMISLPYGANLTCSDIWKERRNRMLKEISGNNADENSTANPPVLLEVNLPSASTTIDRITRHARTLHKMLLSKDHETSGLFPLDIVTVDCEMVNTKRGMELARVTLIHPILGVLLDTMVKPQQEVLDYLTEFSGIRESDLADVDVTIYDILNILPLIISENTIIAGHSLDSDLKALQLVHNRIIDTVVLFPHSQGLPMKHSLKRLCSEHLGVDIQEGTDGHDSLEDALAALDLIIEKMLQKDTWATTTVPYDFTPRYSLFDDLALLSTQPQLMAETSTTETPTVHFIAYESTNVSKPRWSRDSLGYHMDTDISSLWEQFKEQSLFADKVSLTQRLHSDWRQAFVDAQNDAILLNEQSTTNAAWQVQLLNIECPVTEPEEVEAFCQSLDEELEKLYNALPANSLVVCVPQRSIVKLRKLVSKKVRHRWDNTPGKEKPLMWIWWRNPQSGNQLLDFEWAGNTDEQRLINETQAAGKVAAYLRTK